MGIRQGYNDWLELLKHDKLLYEAFNDEVGHNKVIGNTSDCDYFPLGLLVKLVNYIENKTEDNLKAVREART